MLLPCGLQEASPCPAKPGPLWPTWPFHQRSVDQRARGPLLDAALGSVSAAAAAAAVPCLPFLFTVTAPRSPPSSSLPLASRRSIRTVALGQRFGASQFRFGFRLRFVRRAAQMSLSNPVFLLFFLAGTCLGSSCAAARRKPGFGSALNPPSICTLIWSGSN
ncbi:hypothetical protein EJB05_18904, partial [Eragrostis curvula]